MWQGCCAIHVSGDYNAGYQSDTDGSELIRSRCSSFTLPYPFCGVVLFMSVCVCVYVDFYFWEDFKLQNIIQIVL